MRVGVQYFPSVDSISPVDFARAAEERGFESVFFPDHTHVPVGSASPPYYRTLLDTIVVLGAVAVTTSRIRIGTAVCLVPQRDPITLAKQIASIDQLSNGRLLFGVGAGSDVTELRNHGVDPDHRFAVLRERILAMKAIWSQDEAAYDGRFVSFGPLWSWPKPRQRPGPPILLGAGGPRALERVVEWADGWLPFRGETDPVDVAPSGRVEDFEPELARRIQSLARRAGYAGRTGLSVTLFNGSAHRDALRRYAEMGVRRVVFWLPPESPTETVRRLDTLAAISQPNLTCAGGRTDG